MGWGRRWTLVIVVVGLADFAVRLASGPKMVWVVRAEALLFLGASLALWRMLRQQPATIRWQLRVQQVLVATFALAGLRVALWAAGLAVATANLVVLLAGVVLSSAAVLRWRRARAAA